MRSLFDGIIADGEIAITRLVTDRYQERVDLEFKTKRDRTHGRLDRDDQATLGKALSAFSNSAGGLIVYGVLAKRDADGVDCAAELLPISELDRFLAEVTRAAGELLMPRNDGIQVEPVRSSQDADAGYLAIYVERSERRPHRCEARGDKQYYKRAGSSSYAMEHYDIEDAFKRQERPKLTVTYTLSQGRGLWNSDQPIMIELLLSIHIENSSSMTARFPYVHILSSRPRLIPAKVSERFGLHYIDSRPSSNSLRFEGGVDHVIHPGISLEACRLAFPLFSRDRQSPLTNSDIPMINTEYRAGCENSPAIYGSIAITEDEIMKVIFQQSKT